MTNDQQLWTLIVACAVVMIPLGAMLGVLWRAFCGLGQRCLPPRELRRAGVRQRMSRSQT